MQSCTCRYDVLLASETPNEQWRIYHIHLFSSPESILISLLTFHYVPLSELKLPPPIGKQKWGHLLLILSYFNHIWSSQLYMRVVYTSYKVQGIFYIPHSEFNAINRTLYKVLNSEMNTFKFPFEKQKSNKFPFLACLVLLDIDCRAQGLVSYKLLY